MFVAVLVNVYTRVNLISKKQRTRFFRTFFNSFHPIRTKANIIILSGRIVLAVHARLSILEHFCVFDACYRFFFVFIRLYLRVVTARNFRSSSYTITIILSGYITSERGK